MKKFDEKRICELYKQEKSPYLIIKEFDCGKTTFYRILKRNKIKIFPKGYFQKDNPSWNKGVKMWENRKHPCLGKKLTDKQKKKISKATKKAMQRPKVKEKTGFPKGRKNPKLSKIRKKLWDEDKLKRKFGKENPAWKGGIYKLSRRIRFSRKYKEWRKKVLERDNHTCKKCGKKKELQVHHKNSFIKIIKKHDLKNTKEASYCGDLWDLKNGETLCKECHVKI